MPGFFAIFSRFLGREGFILRGERPASKAREPLLFNNPGITARALYADGVPGGVHRVHREAYIQGVHLPGYIGRHIQGYIHHLVHREAYTTRVYHQVGY